MTEAEYINATNLAKIRCVRAILRDVLPTDRSSEEEVEAATVHLRAWERRLERIVKCSPPSEPER